MGKEKAAGERSTFRVFSVSGSEFILNLSKQEIMEHLPTANMTIMTFTRLQ